MNSFGWQRLEVVRVNGRDDESEEEPNRAKRARLEQHCQTQLLHDGSEIGTCTCIHDIVHVGLFKYVSETTEH